MGGSIFLRGCVHSSVLCVHVHDCVSVRVASLFFTTMEVKKSFAALTRSSYVPVVCTLATENAEMMCARNGMRLADMLQCVPRAMLPYVCGDRGGAHRPSIPVCV